MKKKSVIIDFKIKINYYSLDLTGVLNELWDPIYKLYTLHYRKKLMLLQLVAVKF